MILGRRCFWSLSLLLASQASAQRLVPPVPNTSFCQSGQLCQTYRRIYFAAPAIGYVSEGTNVFRTTDGGATWSPVIGPAAGRSTRIASLFFVDDSTFFVYGDEFLRTTDRGDTFTPVSLKAPSLRSRSGSDTVRDGFFFLDARYGWAPGDEVILTTIDGGITWKPFDLASNIQQFRQLWMFDAQRGIAISRRQVSRTQDGGKTWLPITDNPDMEHVRCVASGFCVGTSFPDPVAYASSDAGATWQATDTGIDRDKDTVYDVEAIAGGNAVIVGSHIDQRPTVLRNIDPRTPLPVVPTPMPYRGLLVRWDGSSWHRTEYPEIETLWTVHYVSATDIWASADTNGILHSTDGAQTWTFVPDYYRQIAALTPSPVPFVVPTPPTTP